jgi:oxygen-dependent protoporphyrinogen oxidase
MLMTDTIAVVGGGIAGLAAAHQLATAGVDVTIFERGDQVGGRIRSSPFAGLPDVDEGADAFLARVPEGIALAADVGLGDALVHPESVGAAVWHNALHPIPDGLLLGVPGRIGPMATTGLLSWRGKVRAAVEPLLPRTSLESDSIGDFVRARFGDEVHERLVDALVGSIYATDTDRFSLAEVPQLDALARANRSLLLGARKSRQAAGTATAASAPIFAAPRRGIADLTRATADAVVAAGGTLRLGHAVGLITAAGAGWDVDGQHFGAVIMATPAPVASLLLATAAPEAATALGTAETADVIMVTLHIDGGEWPDRFAGQSGYLVPKPVQSSVTAVSFGSQKWGHWQPHDGGQILRVSLGRDGQPALHFSDDEVIERVLDDLTLHLGVRFTPREVRISRWPGAFAQYRPHHARWVDAIEEALPAGLLIAGAAYRGIGIPACIRHGTTIGQRATQHVRSLAE